MNAMNTLPIPIAACELAYSRLFSHTQSVGAALRFRDPALPDMYYHNFTHIPHTPDPETCVQLIHAEHLYRKQEGADFCLIRTPTPVTPGINSQLLTPETSLDISISVYYAIDPTCLPALHPRADCSIQYADTCAMIDDIVYLDLQHDGESLGEDFCTRRVHRKASIYLSDTSLNSYICYYQGRPVGNCDLFIHNATAKIENFAILPPYQRQGFGTAVLCHLISHALQQNAALVYLETDEDGTAKEMYEKCGFSTAGYITDLLFKW